MKLIDYVMANDGVIEDIQEFNHMNREQVTEYIVNTYCPSYFTCLENTPYEKPFVKHNNDCKYNGLSNQKKCTECWNREVLS